MLFRKKDTSPVSWIIVFLGNPGARYMNTRHNAGFLTADVVAENIGVKINRFMYNSLTAIATIGKQRVLLLKPQTYMNLCGDTVRQTMKHYSVALNNVIVISDDVSLPVGKLRVRRMGSAGGHNGLKDIIAKCGGEDFPRIKIGVGSPPHDDFDMADWVLSKISVEDKKQIALATSYAAKALEVIISHGIDRAMAEYN